MLRKEGNVVHHLLSLQFAAPPKGVGGAEPLPHQSHQPSGHVNLMLVEGRPRSHVKRTVSWATQGEVRHPENEHVHSDPGSVAATLARQSTT